MWKKNVYYIADIENALNHADQQIKSSHLKMWNFPSQPGYAFPKSHQELKDVTSNKLFHCHSGGPGEAPDCSTGQ